MTNTNEQKTRQRPYRLLIPALKEREIGKTKGYELVNSGLLEVFKIGRRTYVYLDTLDDLPQRLAQQTSGQASA